MAARRQLTSPFPGVPAEALVSAWDALTGPLAAVEIVLDGRQLDIDARELPLSEDAAATLAAAGEGVTHHFSLRLNDLWAIHQADASRFGRDSHACPCCLEDARHGREIAAESFQRAARRR